ncbi:clathrin light chain A-like [Scyliorhinus canicula]|uniref:clathrin light chain A-like n=1 Tax=Scyliorhinus canicula TaxID=7830 RepID=UPI0018F2BE22|nr:clathrin light chain A-like [Scyliorhinus canicula]
MVDFCIRTELLITSTWFSFKEGNIHGKCLAKQEDFNYACRDSSWREEQITRLEGLDAASRKSELECKEKARKELEEWYVRQDEQLEKIKKNNRAAEEAFVQDCNEDTPGTEWERVACLCDFNPKTNKQSNDVSRLRSVLISLKQSPLVR